MLELGLAKAKALLPALRAEAERGTLGSIYLLTADQVVVHEGRILEKPADEEEVRRNIAGYAVRFRTAYIEVDLAWNICNTCLRPIFSADHGTVILTTRLSLIGFIQNAVNNCGVVPVYDWLYVSGAGC